MREEQLSLLVGPDAPVPKSKAQAKRILAQQGRALRDVGIEQAAEHAERVEPDWKDTAYDAFCAVARKHGEFTTEQARKLSRHVPDPPDKRAWGHVAQRAVKAGIIERAGYVAADDPKVHRNVVTLWRSRIAVAS